MRTRIAVVLLLLLGGFGCDEARSDPVSTAEKSQRVTMQLLGVRAPGHVLIQVASLEVTADGRPVSVALEPGQVDLGTADHAWPIATFSVPTAAQQVALTLGFLPDGSLERSGISEPLDLRGAPISWESNATWLLERKRVVLEVDVERSLEARDGQPATFLPEFLVRY